MKLLALDASTQALSVALFDSNAPADVREHFEVAPQAHARRLLPAAERLLAEAGWGECDLLPDLNKVLRIVIASPANP